MGEPKALLRWEGTTFLDSILQSIAASGLEEPVVVLGHHRDSILAAGIGCRWVYNPDYEQGMTTSFQAGIRALDPEMEGAMLFLVDHPGPSVATIDALADAFCPGSIVLPRIGDRRGHPVLFSREVLGEILDLDPSLGANSVVRARAERVIEVNVGDEGVLRDIDSPDDYRKWVDK